MPELSVDTSALREAEADLVAMGMTAVTEVITTTLGVASHNSCWGTDEIGGAFAHAYLEPAEAALKAVQQVPFHIGDVGENLGRAATGYDDTEDSNAGESQAVQADIDANPGEGSA